MASSQSSGLLVGSAEPASHCFLLPSLLSFRRQVPSEGPCHAEQLYGARRGAATAGLSNECGSRILSSWYGKVAGSWSQSPEVLNLGAQGPTGEPLHCRRMQNAGYYFFLILSLSSSLLFLLLLIMSITITTMNNTLRALRIVGFHAMVKNIYDRPALGVGVWMAESRASLTASKLNH